jgi:hypothetical protein
LLGIGCSPGEAGGFEVRPHFEVGWCGQNALYARMLIRDWMRFGHRDSLDLAIDILDAWAEDAVTPTGLMAVHFEKKDTPEGALSDTCNLGYAAAELLRSYRLLKSQGIDKPRYLSAAKGIAISSGPGGTGRRGLAKHGTTVRARASATKGPWARFCCPR